MKKVRGIGALIAEALLYAGAFVFDYFTRKKMGMARYVVYLNHKMEKAVPVQNLIYAAVIALLALLILIFVIARIRKTRGEKWLIFEIILTTALTAIFAGFALTSGIKIKRAYYCLCIFMGAAALTQSLWTLIFVSARRKEKRDEE